MISQDRDYEDILRDALRAAAESVEPASGGLERIRHRSHSRRSARSILTQTADWLRRYRIRLFVRLESFRWELSERGIRHAPAGAHRSSRTPAGKTAGRLGPAAAWFKPAFAVAAVVAVVVVGVVTLNRVPQSVFWPIDSVTAPGHHDAPNGVTGLASPGPWQPPLGVKPSQPRTASNKKGWFALPVVARTGTPAPSSTPTPTVSAPASPTPSGTGTASPTPSGTGTVSPTPSGTVSPSSTPTVGGTASPRAS